MAFMDFGKHRNEHVSSVPSDYLQWALREATCIRPLEELARRSSRPQTNGHARANGKQVELGAVISTWWREMVMVHHPDRGGRTEVMQALNNAHQRLKQLAGLP
jgi:hypothetical protein